LSFTYPLHSNWGKSNKASECTVLRVRTHLITERDNIIDIVKRYTSQIAEPGDIVALAESVVAITQGRAISPDKIRPSLLARTISRFAHPDASVSAPRCMEVAIRQVGPLRITLAAICGLIGKIIRKRGLFFVVAGHEVAEIDDSGGTMPPYDRHIILGPKDPHVLARKIWKETGLWALILDTNDKGCVDVLGSSFPITEERKKLIEDIFKTNPFGNDDQKTPLAVVKLGQKRD
jgi:hypothetical protein